MLSSCCVVSTSPTRRISRASYDIRMTPKIVIFRLADSREPLLVSKQLYTRDASRACIPRRGEALFDARATHETPKHATRCPTARSPSVSAWCTRRSWRSRRSATTVRPDVRSSRFRARTRLIGFDAVPTLARSRASDSRPRRDRTRAPPASGSRYARVRGVIGARPESEPAAASRRGAPRPPRAARCPRALETRRKLAMRRREAAFPRNDRDRRLRARVRRPRLV